MSQSVYYCKEDLVLLGTAYYSQDPIKCETSPENSYPKIYTEDTTLKFTFEDGEVKEIEAKHFFEGGDLVQDEELKRYFLGEEESSENNKEIVCSYLKTSADKVDERDLVFRFKHGNDSKKYMDFLAGNA